MIIYNQPFKNHKQLTCWVYYNEYDWSYLRLMQIIGVQQIMKYVIFFLVVIGDNNT